jgi:uncharacterized protein (TIGR03000 family)
MLAALLLVATATPGQAALAQQAHFSILLEKDAILYIDGKKMAKVKDNERRFSTPFLLNQEYYYTCRVEYKSGRTMTRKITFRPGDRRRYDWREKKK